MPQSISITGGIPHYYWYVNYITNYKLITSKAIPVWKTIRRVESFCVIHNSTKKGTKFTHSRVWVITVRSFSLNFLLRTTMNHKEELQSHQLQSQIMYQLCSLQRSIGNISTGQYFLRGNAIFWVRRSWFSVFFYTTHHSDKRSYPC